MKSILLAIKRLFCRHDFYIDDMELTDEFDPNMRIKWPCYKCGKVFYSSCGLYICHGLPIKKRKL